MNIFISHASANKQYGSVLVELLTGIGVPYANIKFTSNPAYGIPIGENIFDWLKSQIAERCFVVFLLSEEYYDSIACLNEMGAAWVVENEHAVIFLPGFDLGGKDFQNGAIDPRVIGFQINDKDRIIELSQRLKKFFSITENWVILTQKIDRYLTDVNSIAGDLKLIKSEPDKIYTPKSDSNKTEVEKSIAQASFVKQHESSQSIALPNVSDTYNSFLKEAQKLTETELLLLHYLITRSKTRLFCGWLTDKEKAQIKEWEKVKELNHKLSDDYESVLNRFDIRGYTEIYAVTASDNPKEVKLKDEIAKNILDLPKELLEKIQKAVYNNPASLEPDIGLPF